MASGNNYNSGTFPEYYVLLGIPQHATTDEVRQAYKRESLRYVLGVVWMREIERGLLMCVSVDRTHPDRVPNATAEERKVCSFAE